MGILLQPRVERAMAESTSPASNSTQLECRHLAYWGIWRSSGCIRRLPGLSL
ncbi:MAG: hypothetical protein ACI835_002783, partial [Planctomycetota bacterium]